MAQHPLVPVGRLKTFTLTKTGFNSNSTFSVSIDATGIPGYETLTVDNFYLVQVGVNPKSTTNAGAITRSYNADSGILTVKIAAGTSVSFLQPIVVACVKVV